MNLRKGMSMDDFFYTKQLAVVTGIAQADINRFENGTGNPSLRSLKRLAEGLWNEPQG